MSSVSKISDTKVRFLLLFSSELSLSSPDSKPKFHQMVIQEQSDCLRLMIQENERVVMVTMSPSSPSTDVLKI